MDHLYDSFLRTFFPPQPAPKPKPKPRRYLCGPVLKYDPEQDFTRRLHFRSTGISIHGWPSKGGVIVHEDASPADFDFLHLNRVEPRELRDADQDQEDEFCKKLLLLGARWFDSYGRYLVLWNAQQGYEGEPETQIINDCCDALQDGSEPKPTVKERHLISVAWPRSGGLVVAEYCTIHRDASDEARSVPNDIMRMRLCTTMDEKAELLRKRFWPKEFQSLKEYEGKAFMDCWEGKTEGEHGPLEIHNPKSDGETWYGRMLRETQEKEMAVV